MSCVTPSVSDRRLVSDCHSTIDELAALGWELNANQYRVVRLAARYDEELDWFRAGLRSAASALAERLQLQAATAREWVRVGYLLRELPLVDAAFRANEISYAKARILTRWADPDNEVQLLALAMSCTASRLTTAIARVLATDEHDDCRDGRHHETRSFSSYTDGDGMVIIRVALPPSIAKPILAAIEELVSRIAKTPLDDSQRAGCEASADAFDQRSVVDVPDSATHCDGNLSADAFGRRIVAGAAETATCREGGASGDSKGSTKPSLVVTLAELRRRWQPGSDERVVLETHNHECVDCAATDLLEFDHTPPYHQTRRTITDELEPRCAPCHRARHRSTTRTAPQR